MPNTRHSKCLECHIKVANYLIEIVQQDKLNSPQTPPHTHTHQKKKKNHKHYISYWKCVKVYLSHFQIVDRKAKFDISCVTVAIVICAMIIWKETRIHSLMTILKKRDFLYVVWN